ncbi:MarR family winged helix-turn-helix transcriptional regulator [Falsibacillus pallidus]|uniref:MarR family winged helix-turn-helix transcriptional regulator n=1 Tax=Falsibacillus pallidus TaxID=493781 RepID=UPI003D95CFD7
MLNESKDYQKAAQLVMSFSEIARMSSKFTQQNAESLGISLPQLGIINTLISSKGMSQKELGEKLHISKSTISVNIEKLVQMGLIIRMEAEEDRREVILQLTEKGKDISRTSAQNAYSYRAMLKAGEEIGMDKVDLLLELHEQIREKLKGITF